MFSINFLNKSVYFCTSIMSYVALNKNRFAEKQSALIAHL